MTLKGDLYVELIRMLRESKGLTQVQLGEAAGVTSQTVGKMENTEDYCSNMSVGTLQSVAAALGVPAGVLLGEVAAGDDRLENSCSALLNELCDLTGDDRGRHGLADTPARMAAAWREMLTTSEHSKTASDNDVSYDQIVLVPGIQFTTVCEHCCLPVHGKATVGYIPDDMLLGLSELVHIVEHYASGLQLQERLAEEIAEQIWQDAAPEGCGVIIRAEHPSLFVQAAAVTSALRGTFLDADTKREFLSLVEV